jgi:hypothetical protein
VSKAYGSIFANSYTHMKSKYKKLDKKIDYPMVYMNGGDEIKRQLVPVTKSKLIEKELIFV